MQPFPLPDKLERDLGRVQVYWEGLRRAENSMPFWDDLNLSALSDQSAQLLLIDAFDKPERFRFNYLAEGTDATERWSADRQVHR